MKKSQILILLISFFFATTSFAQDVVYKDKTYTIKKKSIYLAKEDVTQTLKPEMVNEIFAIHTINEERIEAAKKAEKEKKAAEKEAKKAEKAIKKKEKALKKKEKALDKLNKAKEKLQSGIKKHSSLKKKGDLSPNDDQKWLEKIEKLKKNVTKAEKKFKKS